MSVNKKVFRNQTDLFPIIVCHIHVVYGLSAGQCPQCPVIAVSSVTRKPRPLDGSREACRAGSGQTRCEGPRPGFLVS